MLCDMCGSGGKLYEAIVEGAQLNVCDNCKKFGKVLGAVKQKVEEKISRSGKIKESQPETIEIIVSDYAEKIRKKRESLGLRQEDFAKKINEKESLIQKIESGHFEPSIELAKKIGRFLGIRLIEDYEEKLEELKKSKTDSFTIGDFINIKNR